MMIFEFSYENSKVAKMQQLIKNQHEIRNNYREPPADVMSMILNNISEIDDCMLEDYSEVIDKRSLMYLAYHLPKEKDLDLNKKIMLILKACSREELFDIYYNSWQDYYDIRISLKNLLFLSEKGRYLAKYSFTRKIYQELCNEKIKIEKVFETEIGRSSKALSENFTDTMMRKYGILKKSLLGKRICKEHYLECSGNDLVSAGDFELCNIILLYSPDEKKSFFINFIKKIEMENLNLFPKLAALARAFFDNQTQFNNDNGDDYKRKITIWYSINDIDNVFGSKERGMYWKNKAVSYSAEKVVVLDEYDIIVMFFNKFVTIEFINNNDGPIYILSNYEYSEFAKEILKNKIKKVI